MGGLQVAILVVALGFSVAAVTAGNQKTPGGFASEIRRHLIPDLTEDALATHSITGIIQGTLEGLQGTNAPRKKPSKAGRVSGDNFNLIPPHIQKQLDASKKVRGARARFEEKVRKSQGYRRTSTGEIGRRGYVDPSTNPPLSNDNCVGDGTHVGWISFAALECPSVDSSFDECVTAGSGNPTDYEYLAPSPICGCPFKFNENGGGCTASGTNFCHSFLVSPESKCVDPVLSYDEESDTEDDIGFPADSCSSGDIAKARPGSECYQEKVGDLMGHRICREVGEGDVEMRFRILCAFSPFSSKNLSADTAADESYTTTPKSPSQANAFFVGKSPDELISRDNTDLFTGNFSSAAAVEDNLSVASSVYIINTARWENFPDSMDEEYNVETVIRDDSTESAFTDSNGDDAISLFYDYEIHIHSGSVTGLDEYTVTETIETRNTYETTLVATAETTAVVEYINTRVVTEVWVISTGERKVEGKGTSLTTTGVRDNVTGTVTPSSTFGPYVEFWRGTVLTSLSPDAALIPVPPVGLTPWALVTDEGKVRTNFLSEPDTGFFVRGYNSYSLRNNECMIGTSISKEQWKGEEDVSLTFNLSKLPKSCLAGGRFMFEFGLGSRFLSVSSALNSTQSAFLPSSLDVRSCGSSNPLDGNVVLAPRRRAFLDLPSILNRKPAKETLSTAEVVMIVSSVIFLAFILILVAWYIRWKREQSDLSDARQSNSAWNNHSASHKPKVD